MARKAASLFHHMRTRFGIASIDDPNLEAALHGISSSGAHVPGWDLHHDRLERAVRYLDRRRLLKDR
jgi:hypothetical protein